MYVFHILLIGYTYTINSLVIHVLIPVYFVPIAGNNFCSAERAVLIENDRKNCKVF